MSSKKIDEGESLDVEKSACDGKAEGEKPANWGKRTVVTLMLTVLTSSQGLLIAMSKANDVKYEYSYTSANCTVEFVKCCISFLALSQVRSSAII